MEIEAKILDINPEEVKKKLEELGAKLDYDELQTIKVFNFPDNPMEGFVRLRKIGDKVELTYKGPRIQSGNVKTRQEIETHIEDFDKSMTILTKMGLRVTQSYEKQRRSYKLGKFSFEIDTYEKIPIPTFLEVEGPSLEEVEKMVEKLGFKKEDMKNYGFGGLLKHYNIKLKQTR